MNENCIITSSNFKLRNINFTHYLLFILLKIIFQISEVGSINNGERRGKRMVFPT